MQSSHNVYDYASQNPRHWEKDLDAIAASGSLSIEIPIWWGEHERLKGLSDYTSVPRLRLEKLLQLCGKKTLKADLRVGFCAGKRSFPDWTRELGATSLVPSPLWWNRPQCLGLEQLPSMFSGDVQDRFVDFVEDTCSHIAPYCDETPVVRSLAVETGIFAADQALVHDASYVECLRDRYGEIGTFNQCFQSNFARWEASIVEKGMRALVERRSWMAAYDCHWARHRLLERLRARWTAKPSVTALGEQRTLPNIRPKKLDPCVVALDGTLVESVGDAMAPLTPGEKIHPPLIMAYRQLSFIWERVQHEGWSHLLLSPIQTLPLEGVRGLVLVCGRYLSRKQWRSTVEFIETGGTVVFSVMLPRYDENMSTLAWPSIPAGSVTTFSIDEEIFLTRVLGAGSVLYPRQENQFNERSWKTIQTLVHAFPSWVPA